LAYCLRFANHARQGSKIIGPISWQESENVLHKVVRYTQKFYYPILFKQLANSLLAVTPKTLAQLAPFVDLQGIIRVGGRLRHSKLNTGPKHPMILPKAAHLTQLIIHHYHLNTLHGGTRLTLFLIHRRFWIVSGRAAVRQAIFKCIQCTRYKTVNPQPMMADLPLTRVWSCCPFTNVGMDYGDLSPLRKVDVETQRSIRPISQYLFIYVQRRSTWK